MREGPNLLKLARKEQCMALLTQLRTGFKLDGRIYRVYPSGEVQYLHPKDGVYPEKVNKSRVGVNNVMRSIGKNPNPAQVRAARASTRGGAQAGAQTAARRADQVLGQTGPLRGVKTSAVPLTQPTSLLASRAALWNLHEHPPNQPASTPAARVPALGCASPERSHGAQPPRRLAVEAHATRPPLRPAATHGKGSALWPSLFQLPPSVFGLQQRV